MRDVIQFLSAFDRDALKLTFLISVVVFAILLHYPIYNWLWIRRWRAEQREWSAWLLNKPSAEAYLHLAHQQSSDVPICRFCQSERIRQRVEKVTPFQPRYGLFANKAKRNQYFQSFSCTRCGAELYRGTYHDEDRLAQTPDQVLPALNALPLEQVMNFSSQAFWGVKDPVRFQGLLEQAKSLVEPGVYLGDNLFTWMRNNSMFEDGPFRQAWEANILTDADRAMVWRRYILACAAYHCVQLPGEFVECGVYLGTSLKTVVDYLGGPAFPKNFWGYDSFDIEFITGEKLAGRENELFEKVSQRFAQYPRVKLVRGMLPDTLLKSIPEKISYLHLDLNHAEGEIAVLELLFERIVPGGIIILDDYEWAGMHRAQKKAEDPWFDQRGYRVFPLPTGQGIVLKR